MTSLVVDRRAGSHIQDRIESPVVLEVELEPRKHGPTHLATGVARVVGHPVTSPSNFEIEAWRRLRHHLQMSTCMTIGPREKIRLPGDHEKRRLMFDRRTVVPRTECHDCRQRRIHRRRVLRSATPHRPTNDPESIDRNTSLKRRPFSGRFTSEGRDGVQKRRGPLTGEVSKPIRSDRHRDDPVRCEKRPPLLDRDLSRLEPGDDHDRGEGPLSILWDAYGRALVVGAIANTIPLLDHL